jgi:hypothetical protein
MAYIAATYARVFDFHDNIMRILYLRNRSVFIFDLSGLQ